MRQYYLIDVPVYCNVGGTVDRRDLRLCRKTEEGNWEQWNYRTPFKWWAAEWIRKAEITIKPITKNQMEFYKAIL